MTAVLGGSCMFRSNPLLWPKPPVIWSYGIAVLSVTTALILTQWPALRLEAAPVSLFLLAVMFSAWLGGVAPGLLATALSALAFYYYFLPPMHSLAAKPEGIPRFIVFAASLLFVGLLSAAQRSTTESLRGARDELIGTVQQLQRTNEALQAEGCERKRAEEKLLQSEACLSEAQRLSHTGSFGWQVSTGKIFWSDETFRIFQYDRTTIPTLELVLQRVHPEDTALVKQTFERASRDGKDFDYEYRLVMPDGAVKYVRVVAHALSDESGSIEFVGAVTDTTESKQAEEALRQSESYLAEAQRLAHTGSWAWGVAGGDALHLSEEWYRIYGLDPEKGTSAWEEKVQRIHPEDRAKWQRAIDRAIDEKSDYEVEIRILLPDGTVKYIHTVGHPVLNASGDVVQFVGSSMDISASKRAEEALRQAQTDLAHVSRVTTMGELTASLAHEINQPIAAAVTNANTCLRWLAGDTPNIEEARAAAMRIVKDQTRAAEIISRIRLLFNKGTPQRELVDVNEVIREMIVLLRGETTRYSISVRTELAADLPQVMGDRVQLQQVLMNLMINGIDAMKDADGTRELIIQSQRAENEQLLVSVSDTGVGLPPQQAEQIFNAFFTTKPRGTGMGLRISRSIVESHGGRLWAADNSPRGASFYLTLPAKVDTHENAPGRSHSVRH
jgi:PAS domain S-box-containing protein